MKCLGVMKRILPFLLPLLLLQIHSCSSQSDHSQRCVKCHTDYCETITCTLSSTCMINGTYLYIGDGTPHTLRCKHNNFKEPQSCDLTSSGGSITAESTCHMVYKKQCKAFTGATTIHCEVCLGHSKDKCDKRTFKPVENIKMNPPGEPGINNSKISWSYGSPLSGHFRPPYNFQLQWKQEGQPWEALTIQATSVNMSEQLSRGQQYKARVRVQFQKYNTMWSDWSPTASWIDTVGKIKPPVPGETGGEPDILFMVLGGSAVVFLVCFLSVLHKRPTAIWIYMVKKIWPHIPNPSKFFVGLDSDYGGNFKDWLGPLYTCEIITSVLQPVVLSPVEITDRVDNIAPCRPKGEEEKRRWDSSDQSSSSCFSNKSYSLSLHPTPPFPPLEPCSNDSPYRPAGEHSGEGERGIGREEGRDPFHERAEKLQAQRQALQSQDSGMGSGVEDQESQESLEDSDGPPAMLGGFDPNAFLFSCSSPLPFPLACFPQPPFTLPGMGLGPGLGPSHPGRILEKMALLPSIVTIEPSGDGYI